VEKRTLAEDLTRFTLRGLVSSKSLGKNSFLTGFPPPFGRAVNLRSSRVRQACSIGDFGSDWTVCGLVITTWSG